MEVTPFNRGLGEAEFPVWEKIGAVVRLSYGIGKPPFIVESSDSYSLFSYSENEQRNYEVIVIEYIVILFSRQLNGGLSVHKFEFAIH